MIERRLAPVRDVAAAFDCAGRVRDRDRVALRTQEIDEPATHLAGAADHERCAARAAPARGDADALLRSERAANQQVHDRLCELR